MKGDFSRDTFDLNKNFSRVLMQQGRVQLDADWNEQAAILLHYMRTLATDLIGRHGGPGDGFKIEFGRNEDSKPDLIIKPGRYYVDGILCENDGEFNKQPVSYFNQPHYQTNDKNDKFPPFPFLVYLDVWERHVTAFEDESLLEAALGDVDTTTRTQVVWQVKLYELTGDEAKRGCSELQPPTADRARLNARALPPPTSDDPCNIEPDARYRGAENQLYRVEIHAGNTDEFGKIQSVKPTFKWSRENGSIVFPVMKITRSDTAVEVRLTTLGRDEKFSLREGDWVELADDAYTLQNRAGNLLQIVSIDRDEMSVTLNGEPNFSVSDNPAKHPLLRRWDQKAGNPQEGGLTLNTDGTDADNAAEIVQETWLTLEDGIQIQFPRGTDKDSIYRTGDYWLIPARTATGGIEWAKDAVGNPQPQLPRGIEHHYAPLGIVSGIDSLTLCRCALDPVARCPPAVRETNKPKDKNS